MKKTVAQVTPVQCPYCNGSHNVPWAFENGYSAVKCKTCGIIFVNPRPLDFVINQYVETGIHKELDNEKSAINRRVSKKVKLYKKIFSSMFKDVLDRPSPIKWLDVGAGYGEIVEALVSIAPAGSCIEGIEPMKPKALKAQARGLNVSQRYLADVKEKYEFISLINVFSHLPDFRLFLKDIRKVLVSDGEFFLETGNIGDLADSKEVPSELDLPDHLVFAGEEHIKGFLKDAGFSIIEIRKIRKDGFLNFGKNIIKKILGRDITIILPYTSAYRSILIRAKLKPIR